MKRKPSPSRLAKGLERAAHEAERYASKLAEHPAKGKCPIKNSLFTSETANSKDIFAC